MDVIVIAFVDRMDSGRRQFIPGQRAGLAGAPHINHGRFLQGGQFGQQYTAQGKCSCIQCGSQGSTARSCRLYAHEQRYR